MKMNTKSLNDCTLNIVRFLCRETGFQVSSSVAVWPSERYEVGFILQDVVENNDYARVVT